MHINTAYNPSSYEREKVNETYPQYLRESSQNIIKFLEEYYQYLNREGFASHELGHVISENDIDFTSEKYLDAIQGEIAKVVPQSSVIDRNTLYKRIIHYYRIKGTPESVEKFFAIFFDAASDVYFPGKDLFKLSEGDLDRGAKYFVAFKKRFSTAGDTNVNGTEYIRPTNNPTLGNNFTIEFTTLLDNAQPHNGEVFSNEDGANSGGSERPFNFTGLPEDPGIITLQKTSSVGAHLVIKQEKRRYKYDGTAYPIPAPAAGSEVDREIIRFSEDIYDDKWHNIKIDYSVNDDGLIITAPGAADIKVENSNISGIDGTYSQQSTTQWTLDGSTHPTGFYAAKEDGMVSFYATTDAGTLLINGEEYKIINPSGVTNWTSIGASAATAGTVFTYNGSTINTTGSEGGYGVVKHRPKIWVLRKYNDANTYDIVYRDGLTNDYHISGGSTRVVGDIEDQHFVEETTGQTQQTANIVVRKDGDIIAEEKIPHNGGYSAQSEKFRMFHDVAAPSNAGARGLLSHFKVTSLSNGFEYRFTETDKTNINSLFDYSGNNNTGLIESSSSPATLTDITQFTLTNFIGGVDTANGVYTVSDLGSVGETWTGPNGHKFVIVESSGLFNWHFFDVDDLDPSHLTTINAPSINLLPRPWQVSKWSPDLYEGAQIIATQTDNWSWQNDFSTLATKPSATYPLPFLDDYGTNTDGFLSDIKKLQDSEFWQDYSYQIRTSIPSVNWSDSYNRLVHPTGMKFFISLLIESISRSQWDRLETYVGTSSNSDSWLFNLTPPIRRNITESYDGQHTPRYQPGWLQSVFGQLIIAIRERAAPDVENANDALLGFASYLVSTVISALETSTRTSIAQRYTGNGETNPGLWNPYFSNEEAIIISGAGESDVNGSYFTFTGSLTHLTPKANTTVYNKGIYYLYQSSINDRWFIQTDASEDNNYYSNTATGSNPPTTGWATATEGTDPAPTLALPTPTSLNELGYMDIPIANFDLITKYVYVKENFSTNVNSYGDTDIISNTGDSDFSLVVNATAHGKNNLLQLQTEPDGAQPQLALRNPNYEKDLSSGKVEFIYYVEPGHDYVGKFWHIGNTQNVYSATGPQIVGGAWTKATVYFGTRYGGKDKGNSQRRFLFGGNAADPTQVTESVTSGVSSTTSYYLASVIITTEEKNKNTIYPFNPDPYKPVANFSNPIHSYITVS